MRDAQRKPELVAEEAKRQQDREQGMRWLAERFWNVYQVRFWKCVPGEACTLFC